ncbi:MAG: hypothetical protein U0S36_08050 [Candidatus Nanopelagicales bacterium]
MQDALAAEGAPALPLWDGEINYGVAGPTAASPHRDLDDATGAGYVARTYLDALRLGISRVYWSAWTPKNSVYGVTMWPGSVGAKAQRTTHDWLVGRYWKGCEEGPGDLVTCRVTSSTSPTSPPATIVWSEGARTTVEVPAGARRLRSSTGAQRRGTARRHGRRRRLAGVDRSLRSAGRHPGRPRRPHDTSPRKAGA